MRSQLLACLLLFSSSTAWTQTVVNTITSGGAIRSYGAIFPPEGGDELRPLVLNLHAGFRNEEEQRILSGAEASVAANEYIGVYPQAIDGDWFGGADRERANYQFISDLIDEFVTNHNADPTRVYMTGWSQGGIFSVVYSTLHPERIAAIGAVVGNRPTENGKLSPVNVPDLPAQQKSIIYIHGTEDVDVPYQGGPGIFVDANFTPVPDILDDWAEHNGCDATPVVTRLPDVDANDRSNVELLDFANCDTYVSADGEVISHQVLHYRMNDAGHAWPGDFQFWPPEDGEFGWLYPINQDISASQVQWDFFSQHQLSSAPHLVDDCDGDGSIGLQDLGCATDTGILDDLLGTLSLVLGDIDGMDGVDLKDFLELSANFGMQGSYLEGDLDLDGSVQFDDFLILSANFGQGTEGGVAAVPEPSGFALLGIILASAGLTRRRNVVAVF